MLTLWKRREWQKQSAELIHLTSIVLCSHAEAVIDSSTACDQTLRGARTQIHTHTIYSKSPLM